MSKWGIDGKLINYTVEDLAKSGTVLLTSSAAIASTSTGSDLRVDPYRELTIDVDISVVSGTSPTYVISIERKGADGIYYPIWTSASQTVVGKVSTTIGKGAETNKGFGDIVRVVETLGGTTPSFTRSVSIKGKS
jgi:hypothetical protein